MDTSIEYQNGKVHPKKFTMWLLCLGILMLFIALTSAYIVRKGDGNWYDFSLPSEFIYSTVLIIISSVTMVFAFKGSKKSDRKSVIKWLSVTLVLAILFIFTQFLGWSALRDMGLTFVPSEGDRMSGTFFIAIAAIHLVHILAGIIFLFVVLMRALKFEDQTKNSLLLDMCNTYWHFIGILWVYLYLFLYFAPEF